MAISTDAIDSVVSINGLRFHYRDWRNAAAQPMVLVHGFSGLGRAWDGVARALSEKRRVLVPDLRGHGESDWAKEYTWQLMVDDLDGFVRALGLDHFALFGHSLGGRLAYMYAGQHPEKLERLVICDVGPEVTTGGNQVVAAIQAAQVTFGDFDEALKARRGAAPKALDDELRHSVEHNLVKTAEGRLAWRSDPSLTQWLPKLRPDAELQWDSLRRISCPTRIVKAELGGTLALETAQQMTQTIPHCTLVEVAGSGHNMQLENPKGLIAAVSDFI